MSEVFGAVAERSVERRRLVGLSEAMAPVWNTFPATDLDTFTDGVISAAVLASAAFRLRDEDALVAALRDLTAAVAHLEKSRANDD